MLIVYGVGGVFEWYAIIRCGKVVGGRHWYWEIISYSKQNSPVNPMHCRYGAPRVSLKWNNDWWEW